MPDIRPHRYLTATLLATALPGLVTPLAAQSGAYVPPSTSSIRIAGDGGATIVVDGRLDDTPWQGAPAVTEFRQREPTAGAPATERTEVRVVYGESTLYVGITAYDSNPDGIIARILQRDEVMNPGGFGGPGFGGDDGVAILFDTFHDHRNGMVFCHQCSRNSLETSF